MVREVLKCGRNNAIPAKKLAVLLGFRTVRDLQKQVEIERRDGAVILCDAHGGGYFVSDDPVELRRFVNTLNARARHTLRAAQSAQKALDEAEGQGTIAGWYDG